MRLRTVLIVAGAAGLLATAFAVAQPMQWGPGPGSGYGGPWRHGPGMMGGGMMGGGMMGSPRRQFAMRYGVPPAYRSLSNPLPDTKATIERGARVYATNCAQCHGASGRGDGEAGRELHPRPANLAWLSQTRMAQWDSYLFWTVSEGGAQFGSAMPPFKDMLSKDDIWAALAYVQAGLPKVGR